MITEALCVLHLEVTFKRNILLINNASFSLSNHESGVILTLLPSMLKSPPHTLQSAFLRHLTLETFDIRELFLWIEAMCLLVGMFIPLSFAASCECVYHVIFS